jgi:hypothetical protein
MNRELWDGWMRSRLGRGGGCRVVRLTDAPEVLHDASGLAVLSALVATVVSDGVPLPLPPPRLCACARVLV